MTTTIPQRPARSFAVWVRYLAIYRRCYVSRYAPFNHASE
jgi:hypothetical protein